MIGPDSPRRADLEQLADRLLKHLVSFTEKREYDLPNGTSAADILSNLVRQALVAKSNGQASGGNAAADAILQQLLQTTLQAPKATPSTNGAAPTPAEIAKILPMSPIDKALGGEALVGMKTPLAVSAYAALSIFQSLGIAGPVTATATQQASTTSQVLLTLIGAFGALGGLSKVDRAVRALSVIAAKR